MSISVVHCIITSKEVEAMVGIEQALEKICYGFTYVQGGNRDADIENGYVDTWLSRRGVWTKLGE